MKLINARSRGALGGVMLGGGVLMLLYWTLYLSGQVDLGQGDPVVSAFESAFLLADTLLGVLLLLAGWSLLARKAGGVYLMVVAAAMSLYLGLLDLVFYSRRGLFSSPSAAESFELILITICIVGGTACLGFGWKLLEAGRS